MTGALTVTHFDYALIEDKDSKGKLISLEARIKKQHSGMAESIIEIGQELATARAILANHRNGTFIKWVEGACGFSERTAYNYMNAFERFGSFATVAKLEDTAMYALAAPKTPEKAVSEAKKLADKGISVTAKLAKELIAKHRGESKPPTSNSSVNRTASPAPREPSTPPKPEPVGKAAPSEKCPNCAGSKWTEDDGWACAKCHHPYGEPVGDPDEDRIGTQRSKTVKTVEALMRAFDDLHLLLPRSEHGDVITQCKSLLKTAKAWK